MNNAKQIIDNHNKQILKSYTQANDTATANPNTTQNKKTCNCLQHNRNIHQTHRKRLQNKIPNHTASFRHSKHRNSTELSKHIWTLKDNNIEHYFSWHILSSHSPYNSSSKRCNLCLKGKFLIIYRPKLSTLKKRNELVSSCRHRNKALLRNS